MRRLGNTRLKRYPRSSKQWPIIGDWALPHVIHTEAENERCTAVLESLLRKAQRTAEEDRLVELLTLLIEDFENREYPMPRHAGPIDILRHLMEFNNLKQNDLLDVFGTASVISEVLKGKRELSKAHIAGLSERFHLSPALFF
jgi:HTH-type transcriptional regulator / antitoxin HigA